MLPLAEDWYRRQLLWAVFLGIFGGGALLLATLGIYGLVSYSVTQRERELGVRIALGATRGEIRQSVVGDGLKLTGIGLAFGMAGTLGMGQVMSSVPQLSTVLYGISPFDPITLVTVFLLFLAVAAIASFLPAARASGTDPITVLRSE